MAIIGIVNSDIQASFRAKDYLTPTLALDEAIARVVKRIQACERRLTLLHKKRAAVLARVCLHIVKEP